MSVPRQVVSKSFQVCSTCHCSTAASLHSERFKKEASATDLCSLELPPSLFRDLTHSAKSTTVTDSSYQSKLSTICRAVAGSSLFESTCVSHRLEAVGLQWRAHRKMDKQLAGASYSLPTMLGDKRSRKA